MLYDTLRAFGEAQGIPVAYRAFKEPTAPPFIVYFEDSSDNFIADNRVYLKKHIYTVELYTTDKMPALEEALEAALDGYIWSSDETYVDSEQMYEKIYTLEE